MSEKFKEKLIHYLNAPVVRKVLLAILAGIISGLAATALYFCVEVAQAILFEVAQGKALNDHGAHLIGESRLESIKEFFSFLDFLPDRSLVIIVPAIGGLLMGLLVYKYAPEAQGAGTEALLDSFHNKQGKIRGRVPIVKGLASIFTIGSGGSGGMEGPMGQIGGGIGSWIAKKFNLSDSERRNFMLAGCAGGLAAIFRAPLGAAITSIEVLYKEDFESEAIIPAVLSSVTAFSVFMAFYGNHELFVLPTDLHFSGFKEIPAYLVLAVCTTVFGMFYTKTFFWIGDLFSKIPVKNYQLPAIGGLLLGLLGYFFPVAFGDGWGALQSIFNIDVNPAEATHVTIKFLCIALIVKTVAISVTIGSKGSAGIFGPSLFSGAILGALVGLVLQKLFPGSEYIPTVSECALVSMAAMFAGVANAPLASIVMVCEVAGGYELLAPLLLVSAFNILTLKSHSLFRNQVENKFASPAHIGDMTVNVLQEMIVSDALPKEQEEIISVPEFMPLGQFNVIISDSKQHIFPVMSGDQLSGMVSIGQIRSIMFNNDAYMLLNMYDVKTHFFSVTPHRDLHECLTEMISHGLQEVFVVSEDNEEEILGILEFSQIIEAYNAEIHKRVGEGSLNDTHFNLDDTMK